MASNETMNLGSVRTMSRVGDFEFHYYIAVSGAPPRSPGDGWKAALVNTYNVYEVGETSSGHGTKGVWNI